MSRSYIPDCSCLGFIEHPAALVGCWKTTWSLSWVRDDALNIIQLLSLKGIVTRQQFIIDIWYIWSDIVFQELAQQRRQATTIARLPKLVLKRQPPSSWVFDDQGFFFKNIEEVFCEHRNTSILRTYMDLPTWFSILGKWSENLLVRERTSRTTTSGSWD